MQQRLEIAVGDGHEQLVLVALVFMAHGLGAMREWRLNTFAERFAERDWMVLVFDYRYLGASEGSPRQLLDINDQLDDRRAALAYGRSLPGVDTDRIAVWGTSFGGGHALRIASEDHQLAAVVAQCRSPTAFAVLTFPQLTVEHAVAHRRRGARHRGVLVRREAGARSGGGCVVDARLPRVAERDRRSVAAAAPGNPALPPRTSAAVTKMSSLGRGLSKNVETGGDPVRPVDAGVGRDTLWGVLKGPGGGADSANGVAARLALRLPPYRPGKDLPKITAPTLLCVCEDDRAAPADTKTLLAAGQDHVQIGRYEGDHFDIYVGDLFERAVRDQTAFLATQFGRSTR